MSVKVKSYWDFVPLWITHRYTYENQIVENRWCPFTHEKKSEYKDAAIDKSYWHLYEKERSKLHPDDRENPIWNEEAKNNS